VTLNEAVRFLCDERARLGLSLRDVAAAQPSGLTATRGSSVATLHRYESGRTVPNLEDLEAWAGALGYDVVLTLRRRAGRSARPPE
jgi:transcriptional regulator with XRE-family HTH domain